MCGRYSLQTPLPDLASAFGAELALDDPGPRFNIAPTDTIAVLRGAERGREIAGLRWGLVPSWARDPRQLPLIINARSESLETKPAFRDLLAGAGVDRWIDPGARNFDRLRDLLAPSAADELEVYPVSVKVNRVGYDEPACIEAESPAPSDQLGLF